MPKICESKFPKLPHCGLLAKLFLLNIPFSKFDGNGNWQAISNLVVDLPKLIPLKYKWQKNGYPYCVMVYVHAILSYICKYT